MEKPYIQTDKRIAAPYGEMPDIVLATLSSGGWTKFQYFEHPHSLQAQFSEQETWGGKRFTTNFSLEVTWRVDAQPKEVVDEIKQYSEFLDPVAVLIKMRHHGSPDQTVATAKLTALWDELKERVRDATAALPNKPHPTEHGSARWATLEEVIDEGYITEEGADLSSRFIIGTVDGRKLSAPKRQTEAHTIVAGPPGVGKSRTMIIPNLLERVNSSAIVTEVSGGEDLVPTVYGATAGYRKSKGHEIYYFNPADLQNSTRFNPIDFISDVGDAIKYSALIVLNTTAKSHVGDQIWSQAEQHLLTALLLYAWGLGNKEKSVEGGKSNLGYIRSLLSLGPINLEQLIRKTGIKEARDRFTEFIRNSSPNFRLGVFSGLIQRLGPWDDPRVCALTEVTDFDAEKMRSDLFTFYLCYPVHRHEFKPIMALAINFLLLFPLQYKFAKPISMLLDEFAAYGQIPRIDLIQAVVRNREIPMVFGFQDIQQLSKAYSREDAEIMFTNTDTKVMFATGSPKTQQLVSELLGRTTKEKKTVSSSGQINRTTFGDALMSPAEVGRIPEGQVLVIRNKRLPILASTISPGHYESFFTEYPPPQKPPRNPPEAIVRACEESKKFSFDLKESEVQVENFKRVSERRARAQRALDEAREANASADYLKQLKEEQEAAEAAYSKFVSTETPDTISINDQESPAPVDQTNNGSSKKSPEDPNENYYVFGSDPNTDFYQYEDNDPNET